MNSTPAYYALVSGKEYGPYNLPDLQAAIEENTIEADCLIRQGLSGDWMPVTDVIDPKKVAIPLTDLAAMRRNSAYRSLRALINLAATVSVIILLVMFGIAASEATAQRGNIAAVVAFQFLAMIIGTLISRGLALVLVDIADIQLSRR